MQNYEEELAEPEDHNINQPEEARATTDSSPSIPADSKPSNDDYQKNQAGVPETTSLRGGKVWPRAAGSNPTGLSDMESALRAGGTLPRPEGSFAATAHFETIQKEGSSSKQVAAMQAMPSLQPRQAPTKQGRRARAG